MNDDVTPPEPTPTPISTDEFLASIQRLTKDLKSAALTLSEREARFLVDAYYAMQRDRIRAAHQNRTLTQNEEPHDVLAWLQAQRGTLEKEIAKALDAYSARHTAGRWARSITGIGPIIAAGLIANLRVREVRGEEVIVRHTAGAFWRFAGLDPTSVWNRNEKRPWNGSLKRLCFLIGESFTKVSNNDSDIYGKIYKARKEYETAKNELGEYAAQAEAALAAKRFGDDTQAKKHYTEGHLPPARIHLRAQRYAVKLFIAHLHHVMYEIEFGEAPPKPYIISHGGHAHFIAPPNWPLPQPLRRKRTE